MKTATPSQEQKDTIAMFKHMAEFGGGPAAPLQIQYGTLENGAPAVWFAVGFTKREMIASMVLSNMASMADIFSHEQIADAAVKHADALLERLKK